MAHSTDSLHGQNTTSSLQFISAAYFEEIKKIEAHRALLLSTLSEVPIQQDTTTTHLNLSLVQQQESTLQTPVASPGWDSPFGTHSTGVHSRLGSTSPMALESQTNTAVPALKSAIKDFSFIIITATFLASVSLSVLTLARSVRDSLNIPTTSISKTLHVVLQIFGCLSLSFNLTVAIVAGSAASLQLRLDKPSREFSRAQALDTKLRLCSTLLHYGLLVSTVAIGCLFGLLLNSPYALLMIIPVLGVVFYDGLLRGRI